MGKYKMKFLDLSTLLGNAKWSFYILHLQSKGKKLSLLDECPVFKRSAIKGDCTQHIQYNSHGLVNKHTEQLWNDKNGKYIYNPGTIWHVSSFLVVMDPWGPFDFQKAWGSLLKSFDPRNVIISLVFIDGPVSFPKVCPTCIILT